MFVKRLNWEFLCALLLSAAFWAGFLYRMFSYYHG